MMKWFFITLFFVTLLVLPVRSSEITMAQNYSLITQDTYVQFHSVNTGEMKTVRDQDSVVQWNSVNSSGEIIVKRWYFQVDISNLSAKSVISANLSFFSNTSSGTPTFEIYNFSGAWSASGVTWDDNQPCGKANNSLVSACSSNADSLVGIDVGLNPASYNTVNLTIPLNDRISADGVASFVGWVSDEFSAVDHSNTNNMLSTENVASQPYITIIYNSNDVPTSPTPEINSSRGGNTVDQEVFCYDTLFDDNVEDVMNVTVHWFKNGTFQFGKDFFDNYVNNTFFATNLTVGNFSSGQSWNCSLLISDGFSNSSWVNSSSIQLVANTPPPGTIPSINSSRGDNTSNDDLVCNMTIYDVDDDYLNASVNWFVNGVSNFTESFYYQDSGTSLVSTLGNGNVSAGEYWNCSVKVDDFTTNSGWQNSSNSFVLFNNSVTTNLSSYSTIVWPTLDFGVLTVLEQFNQTSNCSLYDNSSWVSCVPSVVSFDGSFNSTVFTCTATEINSGVVRMYANCSSAGVNVVSSAVSVTIVANSKPSVSSDFTNTMYDFTLSSFNLTILGINWSTQPTSCVTTLNDSDLTCVSVGLASESKSSKSDYTASNYSCDTNWAAGQPCTNTIDGSLSTYAEHDGSAALMQINFSKPLWAANTSAVEFTTESGSQNFSLPYTCWNYSTSLSRFQLTSSPSGAGISSITCFTGQSGLGAWSVIKLQAGTSKIYRVGMFWNTTANVTGVTHANVTTCTPGYVQEKDYSAYITCDDSSTYGKKNSSNFTFFMDADSNPTITTNLTNQTTTIGQSFDVLINNSNVVESMNCSIIWGNSSENEECNNATINKGSNGVITCTEVHNESNQHSAFVTCNGVLYKGVNSTNYSIIHDNQNPTINVYHPLTTNRTWQLEGLPLTFSVNVSHAGPTRMEWFNISCVNSTHTVYGNNTHLVPPLNNFSFTPTTTNFSKRNEIQCQFKTSDEFDHVTTQLYNFSIVRLNSSDSNFSSIRQASSIFDVSYPFHFGGDNATCSLSSNETTAVSCSNYTNGASPAVFTCTPSSSYDGNVTFGIQCNNTIRTWISNVNSTNESYVHIDLVNPTITIVSWVENKTYFKSNITGNFTFQDAFSLYRWNVSIDGVEIDSDTNTAYNTYTYNISIDPTLYLPGKHNLTITVADGHTAKSIKDYKVRLGGWFDDKSITFDTGSNKISIIPTDSKNGDSFDYEKRKDRYKFFFKPEKDVQRKDINGVSIKDKNYKKISFRVVTEQKIDIVKRKGGTPSAWIVSGNNWVDFECDACNNDLVNIVSDLSTEQDNDAIIDVFYRGDLNEQIEFNSVGDLNVVTYNSTFYTINSTATFTSPIAEGNIDSFVLLTNITGTPFTQANVSSELVYNGDSQTETKTSSSNHISWAASVVTPNITITQNVSFYWIISVDGEPDYIWHLNQTVNFIGIAQNCSNTNYTATINFCGHDEETLTNITSNMTLNVNIDVLDSDGDKIVKQFGFEYDNFSTCYTVCISPNSSEYRINAKIEYGDRTNYVDRKYYILNSTINNQTQTLNLYHLIDAKASDIVLTIYDKNTGSRLQDAYVKILRYYPGKDNGTAAYKTVEIEKSDVNGETLAKMIFADVWYKFIVEHPAGITVLSTDIEKILTTDKLLPVPLSTGNLVSWNSLLAITGDVTCDKTTKVCSFTWNNPTNTDVTGTLRVYQDTGFTYITIYEGSVTSPAATIAYTIVANTTDKKFEAQGWITQ